MNQSKSIRMIGLLSLTLLMLSCGTGGDKSARKTTGAETTNTISGRVFDVNGSPIQSARVWIGSSWLTVENSSGNFSYTDSSGYYQIESEQIGYKSIFIVSQDSLMGYHRFFELLPDSIILKQPISKTLRINNAHNSESEIIQVSILGTDIIHNLSTNEEVQVLFPDTGMFALKVFNGHNELEKSVNVTADTLPIVIEQIQKNMMIFDDFETGCNKSGLFALFGVGTWFLSLDGEISTPSGAESPSDFCKWDTESNSWVMEFDWLVQNQESSFMVLGNSFSDHIGGLDFSKLDSISFKVKGAGVITPVFVTEDLYVSQTTNYYTLPAVILSTEWQNITVSIKDIKINSMHPEELGMDWELSAKRTRLLQFVSGSNGSLSIDSIVFFGITSMDMVQQWSDD